MAGAAAGKLNTVTGRNGMRLKQESDHAEAQRWVDAYVAAAPPTRSTRAGSPWLATTAARSNRWMPEPRRCLGRCGAGCAGRGCGRGEQYQSHAVGANSCYDAVTPAASQKTPRQPYPLPPWHTKAKDLQEDTHALPNRCCRCVGVRVKRLRTKPSGRANSAGRASSSFARHWRGSGRYAEGA